MQRNLSFHQILVMDDGRIAASGTHDELLASSALYREIVQTQQEKGVTINE